METNNEIVVPAHYNPNQLVTYKVIDLDATDQTISYPTVKVTEIEWDLEQARKKSKRLVTANLRGTAKWRKEYLNSAVPRGT